MFWKKYKWLKLTQKQMFKEHGWDYYIKLFEGSQITTLKKLQDCFRGKFAHLSRHSNNFFTQTIPDK